MTKLIAISLVLLAGMNDDMAEWLRAGLQNLLHRFKSDYRLTI